MRTRLEHRKAEARLSGRFIVSAWLETTGVALLLCAPIVLFIMPLVLPPPATYSFNPLSDAGWLGATGLTTLVTGVAVRTRILRPDFVNSIMLYQENQS